MEDRFCAIRAAIGTAQARDVVVIAGKGNQDYQEYGDGEGGVIKVRHFHVNVLLWWEFIDWCIEFATSAGLLQTC